MSVRIRLALVVVLQTLVLFAMVAVKQWTLASGTPVLLETEPIDPRSLFRGDYVRLNYAISCLDPDALAGDDEFARHDRVYVLLRQGDRYWEPVSLHRGAPQVPDDHVVIRGEVTNFYCRAAGGHMRLRYGIENYFVPEGEGRSLERPAEGEIVSIQVAVDRNGKAGIKAVLVNGEVRYEERLF